MSRELSAFLTLEKAAQRFHLSKDALIHLVRSGRIRAARVDGEIIVAESDLQRTVVDERASLPIFVPVEKASQRFHLTREGLSWLIESGKVQAVRVDGEINVSEDEIKAIANRIRSDELWLQVEHLDGTPIGVEEARRKYRLSSASLYHWIELGYVRILDNRRGGGRGRKRKLNEADVAYIALLAEKRDKRRGQRILPPDFLPPHLMSPVR